MTETHITSEALDKILGDQEKPWWFSRCTHRDHAYWCYPDGSEWGCWHVLREAEKTVVLQLICLQQVHVCVEIDGSSICKAMRQDEWAGLTEQYRLALVQDLAKDLRSIARM
jgi:hypothetical protein